MAISKEPVRIRQRAIRDGMVSLYLDIYVSGVRRYETLRIYLEPETSRAAKERNKERWRLAETVRAQRIIEIQNERWGFESKSLERTNFLDYVNAYVDKRGGLRGHLRSSRRRIERYCHPKTTFRDITKGWVEGFKEFVEHGDSYNRLQRVPLSDITRRRYFSELRGILNSAVRDGIISSNPAENISGIKAVEKERLYLTFEEVKAMAVTGCNRDSLKRGFLFACLTGLRLSDISNLKWGDVSKNGDFTRITFRQKKTKRQEYLDISDEAAAWMGKRGEPHEEVFRNIIYTRVLSKDLRIWASRAGVNKNITFHTSRHTFAVLMLELDVDIYTLQKLLGHASLSTTAIYAKVLDRKKQEAVSRIPKIGVDKKEEGTD